MLQSQLARLDQEEGEPARSDQDEGEPARSYQKEGESSIAHLPDQSRSEEKEQRKGLLTAPTAPNLQAGAQSARLTEWILLAAAHRAESSDSHILLSKFRCMFFSFVNFRQV